MKHLKNNIKLLRTEQWEWTAAITVNKKTYMGTGSSEHSAELHLLRFLLFGDVNKKPVIMNE